MVKPFSLVCIVVLTVLCANCNSYYGLQTAEAMISPVISTQEAVKQLTATNAQYEITIHNTKYPNNYTSLNITSPPTCDRIAVSASLTIQATGEGQSVYFSSISKLSDVSGVEQRVAACDLAAQLFSALQQSWQLTKIQYQYDTFCN